MNIKVELESMKIQKQVALCGIRYRENECGQAYLVPALVSMCDDWERCMVLHFDHTTHFNNFQPCFERQFQK